MSVSQRGKVCCLALITLTFFAAFASHAQSGKIPPFSMRQSDGKIFRAQNLPMGKPVILVYFSPDCDHCEKLTEDILKQSADFSKASIAMITYLPVISVAKFADKYKLKKFTNIYVGTEEETFFVRNYYKIMEMPFVALYSKQGDLIKTFSREVPLKNLAERLKALK